MSNDQRPRSQGRADEIDAAGRLTVRCDRAGRTYTITAAGEVDLATVDPLRDAVEGGWRSDAGRVVIDLRDVMTFIDSSGIRLLLQMSARSSSDGNRLTLRAPAPPIMRILTVSGLADLIAFER